MFNTKEKIRFDVNELHNAALNGSPADYIAKCSMDEPVEHVTNYLHMLLTAVEEDENSKIILGRFANMLPAFNERELDGLIASGASKE